MRLVPEESSDGAVKNELAVTVGLQDPKDGRRKSLSIGKLQAELSHLSNRFVSKLNAYIQREFSEYSAWLNAADEETLGLSVNAPDIPCAVAVGEGRRDTAEELEKFSELQKSGSLRTILEEEWYMGQIIHVEVTKARLPSIKSLPMELDPRVGAGCSALGIDVRSGLYSHQVEAIEHAVLARKDVILATSTASGKSLCYNITTGQAIANDTEATALYLFPTKALARDQLNAMRKFFTAGALLGSEEIEAFDGDVAMGAKRAKIRSMARVLVSNPDILHASILPKHGTWAKFLRGLRVIAVDEAHIYRGAFGVGCAMVLRRLLYLCENVYGTRPVVICCSATVGNAAEHAQRLIGRSPVHVIQADGSPRAAKLVVLWNPPLKANVSNPLDGDSKVVTQIDDTEGSGKAAGMRKSSLFQTALVLTHFVSAERRTIAFTKARKLAELLTKTVHEILAAQGMGAVRQLVKCYRGGYLPAERRKIESELVDGSILAVIATSALELGIDIGDLETSVHLGFPGSISSLRQQIGRAGRVQRQEPSVSVLILYDAPLDQHYAMHPDQLFRADSESIVIDPSNSMLLRRHLRCAISEKSVHSRAAIEGVFGPQGVKELEGLEAAGEVRLEEQGSCCYSVTEKVTESDLRFSIRSSDNDKITVQVEATGEVVEQVETNRSIFYVYPGAVYIFSGRTFLVKSIDFDTKVAQLKQVDDSLGFYTSILDKTRVHIKSELAHREFGVMGGGKVTVHYGRVQVATTVYAYHKVNVLSSERVDTIDLDLPPLEYATTALWIDAPSRSLFSDLDEDTYAAGLHTIEHLLVALAPLFLLVDETDIRGWYTKLHRGTGLPQIFLYETVPSGVGIAKEIFEKHVEAILTAAMDRLKSCPCGTLGCPSCIHINTCGFYNEDLDKPTAEIVLHQCLLPTSSSVPS